MNYLHKFTCHITSDATQLIDDYCREKRLARSEVVRMICEQFFEDQELKKRLHDRRQVSAELATIGIDILLQKFAPEMRQAAIERAKNTVELYNEGCL